MLGLVNNERLHNGMPPFVSDPHLRDVAREHSLEMKQAAYFSHDSQTAGSFMDRLSAAGIDYGTAGENLALAPDAQTAFLILSNDPSHHDIMLDPAYTRIGIGVVNRGQQKLFTLMFTD